MHSATGEGPGLCRNEAIFMPFLEEVSPVLLKVLGILRAG